MNAAGRQEALRVMAESPFPFLATEGGGQPSVRPISPLKTEGFTVWFANFRRYGKTRELARNPKAELCYLTRRHDQVRLTGVVMEIAEPEERRALWEINPLLRKYAPDPDNADLMFYRFDSHRVRFMKEWAVAYEEIDP